MSPRRLRRKRDTRSAARSIPGSDGPGAPVARTIPHVTGFRLVRQLGAGARSDVFLAIPDGVSAPGAAQADAVTPRPPVVIKAGRGDSAPGLLLPEAEALSRVSHPHVLRLLDVAQVSRPAPGGGVQALPVTASCLVVERLPRESLAALLLSRPALRLGEAITILAPIASAVDCLHRSGVAHGAISAGAVLFRASGAPVLARFGAAQLFDAGLSFAALDSRAGVLADRAALYRLVSAVLARVGDGSSPDIPDDIKPAALAARLFELGTPEPVDFVPRLAALDAAAAGAGAGTGARKATGTRVALAAGRLRIEAATSTRGSTRRRFTGGAGEALALVRSALAPVRPRFWVTGGLVAIALVAALLAIPDDTGPGSESSPGSRPAPSGGMTSVPDGPETPPPAVPGQAVIPGSPLIRGDDPVAALGALLDARAGCYRQLSSRCLAGVDQAGSAALASDLASVRAVQDGKDGPRWAEEDPRRVQLVQRLGDSALMRAYFGSAANSKPAPILVMRTEAGWRIRDYLEE